MSGNIPSQRPTPSYWNFQWKVRYFREKKHTGNILYKPSASWLIQFIMMSWEPLALKEGTRRYPWQPESSNFKSGHTNCHSDLITQRIKNKNLCLKCDLIPSLNLRLFDSHCRMWQNKLFWCHDWFTHEMMFAEQT